MGSILCQAFPILAVEPPAFRLRACRVFLNFFPWGGCRCCDGRRLLAISGDQPDKRRIGAKRIDQVGNDESKRGTGVHNGRKGAGTQGRCYGRVMMRVREGEEAVHA